MWMATIGGAILGAIWMLIGWMFSKSAIQEAAVAAQALALAVIPYIIARASSEHDAEKRRRDAED